MFHPPLPRHVLGRLATSLGGEANRTGLTKNTWLSWYRAERPRFEPLSGHLLFTSKFHLVSLSVGFFILYRVFL